MALIEKPLLISERLKYGGGRVQSRINRVLLYLLGEEKECGG